MEYLQAGTANPSVTLYAVNLRSNTLNSIELKPPDGMDIRYGIANFMVYIASKES
jgi:hypothetical protein